VIVLKVFFSKANDTAQVLMVLPMQQEKGGVVQVMCPFSH
jgi:hypothetical protein